MRPTPTRRGFLGASAAIACSSAITPARAIPPWSRTRPARFKLSLAAYSYRDLLTAKPPKMSLFEFADRAADMGLDAIEPTSYYFPENVDSAFLRKLSRHAFLNGLDISGTAVGNDFATRDDVKRKQQIEHVRVWIDHAAELGAPVIRIFAGSVPEGDTEDATVARVVAATQEALSHAERRGIFLALENHGGITARPEAMLKIVKAVDSPYFGVNLDTGNFHTEDPYADLAEISPYAVNVQVKTEIQRVGHAKELADFDRLAAILKDAKYSGYVALEHEADEDPLTTIPGHVARLRKALS